MCLILANRIQAIVSTFGVLLAKWQTMMKGQNKLINQERDVGMFRKLKLEKSKNEQIIVGFQCEDATICC